MVCVGKRTSERQHDAPLDTLGHAAGALANIAANHIGLLEFNVRTVQDERLAPPQFVLEQAPEAHSPSFGESSRDVDARAFARIEINVKVLSLQYLEVERSILNFVAAKVLGRGGCADSADDRKCQSCGGHTE